MSKNAMANMIARVLRDSRNNIDANVYHDLVHGFADELEMDNIGFDFGDFADACGIN